MFWLRSFPCFSADILLILFTGLSFILYCDTYPSRLEISNEITDCEHVPSLCMHDESCIDGVCTPVEYFKRSAGLAIVGNTPYISDYASNKKWSDEVLKCLAQNVDRVSAGIGLDILLELCNHAHPYISHDRIKPKSRMNGMDDYVISPKEKGHLRYSAKEEKKDGRKEELLGGDNQFGYILVDRRFKRYKEGVAFLNFVVNRLRLPRTIFTNIRVQDNAVAFEVHDETNKLNVHTVTSRIDLSKDIFAKQFRFKIISSGIMTNEKDFQELIRQSANNNSIILIAAGVAFAIVLLVCVIIVIHKRRLLKRAVYGDYFKIAQNEDPQKQPLISSRSSSMVSEVKMPDDRNSVASQKYTKPWCEESTVPVVIDVPTAHLILTYIEQHRNEAVIEKEWSSLIAYKSLPIENLQERGKVNYSKFSDDDPKNPAYIVTSSPTYGLDKFWDILWKENCYTIVDLCTKEESGLNYWSELKLISTYGKYEVHLVSEHGWCADFIIRVMLVRNTEINESRTYSQFHYVSWEENSMPDVISLLEFRRKVNSCYRSKACSTMVHCSDGLGRSGTYILLDMVLNRIVRGVREIDIAATLEFLRDQRAGIVKTKQQYQFVFIAVAEELMGMLKTLKK